MELPKNVSEDQQAMWKGLEVLGVDTDGDPHPGALISGMGEDGFRQVFIREVTQAREVHDEAIDDMCWDHSDHSAITDLRQLHRCEPFGKNDVEQCTHCLVPWPCATAAIVYATDSTPMSVEPGSPTGDQFSWLLRDEVIDHVANFVPLGFDGRDPHDNVHEAARSILSEVARVGRAGL